MLFQGQTSDMELYLLTLTLIIFGYWCWKYARLSKNLPPGPLGIPFLGYIPFMGKNQHLQFSKLRAKYGDIFGFYIGQKFFVILSSYAAVKEALVKQGSAFEARPVLIAATPPEFQETPGIIINSGKLYTEFKPIVLSFIKKFTRSDGNGEFIIQNEIEHLLREIDLNQGKPTNISELIFSTVANVIWFCLFAERQDKNDPKFKAMLLDQEKRVESVKTVGIELAFPQIFYIPLIPKIFQASIAIDAYRNTHKYFDDKINDIESSSKATNEFNFVSEWFKLHPKDSVDYDFYRKQLTPIVMDLFGAASETTAVLLQWAILYMIQFPRIQKKVQDEINEVIGKFNKPSMLDKNKMPFTEATLMEVHRILPIAPLGVPHLNINTATICGYTIPKNSVISANIWEIHHNPEIFPNPEEFRPERFLEHGEIRKIEELIPFSIGKRQCVGKSLGQMESFLIFTSLLQRFTFKKPDGVELDLTYDFAISVSPRPYNAIAIPN